MIAKVTKKELKNALTELGIEKGMTLEVHSSLSSFGHPPVKAWYTIQKMEQELKNDAFGLWGMEKG